MNNRGRDKTPNSVSNVSMLGRQRKAIGEFQNTPAKPPKSADRPRGPAPAPTAKRDGFKVRSYADVKRAEKRKETIRKAEAVTPYQSNAHYAVATGGLSAAAINKRTPRKGDSGVTKGLKEDNRATHLAEMGVYRSTSTPHMAVGNAGPVAILHSFQDDHAKQRALTNHNIVENEHQGNIYEPNIYGNNQGHDMRSNSAWLLGLAHHGRSAVMSTPLNDTNLVRNSAPIGEKTTTKHLSALGREVLGMVQRDHFAVGPDDAHGNQVLTPTASAPRAKLTDFKTPKGRSQSVLKAQFQQKGLDVTGIT